MNNKKPNRADNNAQVLSGADEKTIQSAQVGESEQRLSYDELLNALRIHQIELEIQNGALRHSQSALQKSRTHYI
jgi:hypothetical protein